jgi:starvation-inducible DNA-binding protein
MASQAIGIRMFQTRNDLPAKEREAIVKLVNKQLAETADLYFQTKHAHWNVKGPAFFQFHELFDQLATDIFEYIDRIAERATALGGTALGTMRMAAENSTLSEYPREAVDEMQHLNALIERWAAYAKSNRQAIDDSDRHKDKVTADLFTNIGHVVDKDLWFLESHIQKAKTA